MKSTAIVSPTPDEKCNPPLGAKHPFVVPRRASELTPEWLTAALHWKRLLPESARVVSVSHKPIGDGVMGDISAVDITYSTSTTGAPTRLVAKFSPTGKAPLPGFIVRAIFKAESSFYNNFSVANGGVPRPECYLALYDKRRRTPSFCLLLQDMQPATMYVRVVPKERACGLADKPALMAFMGAIAKLHASWWEHPKVFTRRSNRSVPELLSPPLQILSLSLLTTRASSRLSQAPPLDWVTHPSSDLCGLVLRAFMRTAKLGLPALVKLFPQTYAPIASWLPALRRRHRFIVSECLRPPLTLTHGDAHIENAFFSDAGSSKDGGVDAAIIDFGNMMFSPGTSDIAFFMVHSLDVDVRRAVEMDLLAHYHASLVANGVDPLRYTYERCLHDYRFNTWRALLSVCAMAPALLKDFRGKRGVFAPEARMTEEERKTRATYEALNTRCVAALQDHKWLELLIEEGGTESCGLCSGMTLCY